MARWANYALNLVAALVLSSRHGWWAMFPAALVLVAAEALMFVAQSRRHVEWWQFASMLSTLPMMGWAAAVEGGAASPYLFFTVASTPFFSIRFGRRGGIAGTGCATATVLLASAVGSGVSMFNFPDELVMTLLLQWSVTATLTVLVHDERMSRDGARHDYLTGLLNRRALDDELTALVSLAKRSDRWLAAMYVDIDQFKGLNDNFGHRVGDATLAKVGEVLHGRMRASDRCIRAGGDEFIVLLPDTGPADASALAERVRSALCSSVPLPDGTNITVSIGVAALRGPELDGSTLLHEADLGLYRAKAAGRNRVAVGTHHNDATPDVTR
jgi:diguanylate cyclase (GGDEF)-like protein